MMDWTTHPSKEAFEDALRKGLGRAVLWAARGFADSQQVLGACLTDLRFDRQFEDPRGDWLWQIVDAGSFADHVRQSLCNAISTIEVSDAPEQLCQLAYHFANRGDEEFRQQLERIVLERPVAEMPWLGDEELIWLDGEEGFLMAVRRRVAELKTRQWEWFDCALVDDASEILGGEHVAELLETESSLNDGVKEFCDMLSEDEESHAPRSGKNEVCRFGADDVIAAAESATHSSLSFRTWGRFAEAADIERVFERMLQCQSPEAIEKYLQVFAKRGWPRFDGRVLQLCESGDGMLRRRAATVIAFNRHPAIRSFALVKLREPDFQEFAVEMLANNYEPGDELVVMNALVLPCDPWQRHSLLINLRQLFDQNIQAKCNDAAMLIYEETPCSMCRHGAVELLINRSTLPPLMREECCFDVYAETRALCDGDS